MSYLLVGLGSALGGMARHGCTGIAQHLFGAAFPWGTLLVNVAGSLIIGFLATYALDGRPLLSSDGRALLIVGVCGGFTTFSAFSIETLNLARNGDWFSAAAYIAASLVLCLLAVCLGYLTAAALSR